MGLAGFCRIGKLEMVSHSLTNHNALIQAGKVDRYPPHHLPRSCREQIVFVEFVRASISWRFNQRSASVSRLKVKRLELASGYQDVYSRSVRSMDLSMRARVDCSSGNLVGVHQSCHRSWYGFRSMPLVSYRSDIDAIRFPVVFQRSTIDATGLSSVCHWSWIFWQSKRFRTPSALNLGPIDPQRKPSVTCVNNGLGVFSRRR